MDILNQSRPTVREIIQQEVILPAVENQDGKAGTISGFDYWTVFSTVNVCGCFFNFFCFTYCKFIIAR